MVKTLLEQTETELGRAVRRGHEAQMIRIGWDQRHRRDSVTELCGPRAIAAAVKSLRVLGPGPAISSYPHLERPRSLRLVPAYLRERRY